MARIAFHYFHGNSLLHRWDARCKFFGLLMISATLIQTGALLFIFDSSLLLGLLFLSRLPLKKFLRDMKSWIVLLFILFFFQVFLSPGERYSLIAFLPISRQGLLLGGLTCWRLGLILGYAVLFTAVTRPRELRDALVWILKPIPFLPERRIGLMVSLTLSFLLRILDQYEEVNLAYRARLGDQERNPIRMVKFLGFPILRRSILEVEEVTLALAARGYREDLPTDFPKIPHSHWIPLIIFLLFLITIWEIQF